MVNCVYYVLVLVEESFFISRKSYPPSNHTLIVVINLSLLMVSSANNFQHFMFAIALEKPFSQPFQFEIFCYSLLIGTHLSTMKRLHITDFRQWVGGCLIGWLFGYGGVY